MEVLQLIRFIVGAILIILGLIVFFVEVFGVYRFRYVLNRMHSAAMGDTLGLALCILGLIILCGINFTSLKLLSVIVFLWLASPVSSHLIASLEFTINEEPGKYQEINIESNQENADAPSPEELAIKKNASAEAENVKEGKE